jgi:hypothetical protein
MDHSRRTVESYWRSHMVDGVTAEEDKVVPHLEAQGDLRAASRLRRQHC